MGLTVGGDDGDVFAGNEAFVSKAEAGRVRLLAGKIEEPAVTRGVAQAARGRGLVADEAADATAFGPVAAGGEVQPAIFTEEGHDIVARSGVAVGMTRLAGVML